MSRVHGWQEVSLGNVRPQGWIEAFLKQQREGLTGHLEVAGYPFNTKGWLSNNLPLGDRGGSGWWPYEQIAYWVDGMIRAGILLDDDFLKKKARRQIDHVLSSPDADGYLGPDAMKTLQGANGSERWPVAVFMRAIMADYDDRPSKQTLKKLVRHYLSGTATHDTNRNVCNIETMAWLYELTGDKRMLRLALASYENYQVNDVRDGATLKNMLSGKRIGDHGPRHMELFKLGALLYRVTGNKKFLKASLNANRKLIRDHVLIDGLPSTTEHLRGIYSTAGHETCVITDYLWSLGYLLLATGDAAHADAMEKICFNALPGAVTSDFRALQYFSGPNQVIAGPQTNHHPHGMASTHISFRPNPATECCPGNVHRAMPAYAGRMWLSDGRGGIIAALYGPSTVCVRAGAANVVITEETNYPFSDDITFRFQCSSAARLTFSFRIPGWCRKARLSVNGSPSKQRLKRGSFAAITRTFHDGDTVTLHLPKSLRTVEGPENSVGFEWGPIVMSLGIKEKRTIVTDDRSTPEFPAWTMEPKSPWNYGVSVKKGAMPDGTQLVVSGSWNAKWEVADMPVKLRIPARRIPGWRLIRKRTFVQKNGDWMRIHKGDIAFMPSMPDERQRKEASKKVSMIELVPYGSTNLRVTWFPVLP